MPFEIETGMLAGIRQDYLLFLAVIGSVHFVLMAIGTTFSSWGESTGRRLFLGLAVAGSCLALMVFVQLTAFVWILDSPALTLACDLLRFLAAAGLLWSGCALSPRFTWGCAAGALAAIGLLAAGLAAVFGLYGVALGTGIGIFGASVGLVVHILRFQTGGDSPPGLSCPCVSRPVCLLWSGLMSSFGNRLPGRSSTRG